MYARAAPHGEAHDRETTNDFVSSIEGGTDNMARFRSALLLGVLLAVCLMLSPSSGSAAPTALPKVTLRFAFSPSTTDPTYLSGLRWAAAVSKATKGGLTIKLYPNGSLGSDAQIQQQAAVGAPVITLTTPTYLATFLPDMNVLGGPFLFSSPSQEAKVLATPLVQGWNNTIAKHANLHVLAMNWFFGVRYFVTTKQITGPADLRGMKMRVPSGNPMFNDTYQALGAIPTTLNPTDLYTSLKTGVIDGADFPLPSINGFSLQQVAKYITLVPLFVQMNAVAMSQQVWRMLPPAYQKALTSTALAAGVYDTNLVETSTKALITQMQAGGATVTTPSAAEIAAFAAATEPVYSQFSNWTPGLYKKIVALRDAK